MYLSTFVTVSTEMGKHFGMNCMVLTVKAVSITQWSHHICGHAV